MAQVYVIGAHKGRSFLPCAYILLPGKDHETYRRAFTALFTLPELRDTDPSSIACDFEMAPRNVMQDLFSNARTVHCQFHLAQVLIKHIQRDGLTDRPSFVRCCAFCGRLPSCRPEMSWKRTTASFSTRSTHWWLAT
ncbi:hypothetical protein AAVH_14835 [Aphelenchoides avenae]|nr:hypothetical protein AAVH_14835 [Aphelenchus avenae]